MTRLTLLSVALAVSGALWIAIITLLGPWPAAILTYLYLLAIAAVASVGGINAVLLWLEWRRREP